MFAKLKTYINKSFFVIRKRGVHYFYTKLINKLCTQNYKYEYNEWIKKSIVHSKRTEKNINLLEKNICINIIAITSRMNSNLYKITSESLTNQKYKNYIFNVIDFNDIETKENNILNRVLSIVNNNAADYIMFVNIGDEISEYALFESVSAIVENKEIRLIYFDDDFHNIKGKKYYDPRMKPDYDPELLFSTNYIGDSYVIRRDTLLHSLSQIKKDNLIDQNEKYGSSIIYDILVRSCENCEKIDKTLIKNANIERLMQNALYTSATIFHIPKVLYHIKDIECDNNKYDLIRRDKEYKRIIELHYSRCKMQIVQILCQKCDLRGSIFYSSFETKTPLISIIIPNKDHTEDLDKAIRSISGGNYKRIEFIIVENNSEQKKTWDYYDKIQKEFSNIKVVKWNKNYFNYSALNNYGANVASGDYYLFVNNDIELISDNAIREMLMYAQRDDVGICGAKLLFRNHTIQHAGIIIGMNGIAGHAFEGCNAEKPTYMNRADCVQDYTAVTAAVMLVKKTIFNLVGGFDVNLAVAFNDIDFCLKVRSYGMKIVYDPYAVFIHYESKSRGLENSKDKLNRFRDEAGMFCKRWSAIVKKGDPYYNPQLTLRKNDFSLRMLPYEKIGEPYSIDELVDL